MLTLNLTRPMKAFWLLFTVSLYISCASNDVPQSKNHGLGELVKQNKNVFFEDKVFEDEIDFTSYLDEYLISTGVYQVKTSSSITFKNCTFKKPVLSSTKSNNGVVFTLFMDNLTFLDCHFEDVVNFRGTSVYGKTDFTKSVFNKSANFEETNFYRDTHFRSCIFEEELRFQNSFFMQKANFTSSEFNANTSFQNAVFNSEIQFNVCKFYKYADFSLIDCRASTFFNYAEFYQRANFGNAYYGRDFSFINTVNSQSNFKGTRFMGEVKLFESTFAKTPNFESTFFLLEKPDLNF